MIVTRGFGKDSLIITRGYGIIISDILNLPVYIFKRSKLSRFFKREKLR